jgi:hypothetical protein
MSVVATHVLLADLQGPARRSLARLLAGLEEHPGFARRARGLGADAWVRKERAGEDLPRLPAAA